MTSPVAVIAAVWMGLSVAAAAQPLHVKIGVMNDMSGVYSGTSGPGSVVTARLAIEEFQASHPGIAVELVTADHANKADLASGIARRWYEAENVDAIADIQNSAIAVAVQAIANADRKISLATGAVTPELTGKACSPTGLLWSLDAYSLVTGPVQALTDKKKWFFITVDLAGGLLFESEGRSAVLAAGDQVVGSAHHPLGSADMSAYVLQAQAAGADAVALANAGSDTINSIKAASEFGLLDRGVAVVPLLMFEPDVKAVGLATAKGMLISTGFYWDLNDASRAFTKRFQERFSSVPTQYQASVYAAVRHYLEAVAATGTTDGAKVMAAMRATPAFYFGDKPATIRPDGRTIYDVHVMQVKSPQESKGPWDLLRLVRTIPGEQAFRPLDQSTCPLLNGAAK